MLCCQIAFRLRDARVVSNAAMFMRLLASTAAATHNSKRSWPSFSRAVVFVEGEAEVALVPVFARTIGIDLDELGISICSVGGVNFSPYVKLATALDLPFSVITDWDPQAGAARSLGWNRSLALLKDIRVTKGQAPFSAAQLRPLLRDERAIRAGAAANGIHMNDDTLELEITRTEELAEALLSVIEAAQFGPTRQQRIADWKVDPSTIDPEQLFSMIADIGKGRLAGRLALAAIGLQPPEYIRSALENVARYVRP